MKNRRRATCRWPKHLLATAVALLGLLLISHPALAQDGSRVHIIGEGPVEVEPDRSEMDRLVTNEGLPDSYTVEMVWTPEKELWEMYAHIDPPPEEVIANAVFCEEGDPEWKPNVCRFRVNTTLHPQPGEEELGYGVIIAHELARCIGRYVHNDPMNAASIVETVDRTLAEQYALVIEAEAEPNSVEDTLVSQGEGEQDQGATPVNFTPPAENEETAFAQKGPLPEAPGGVETQPLNRQGPGEDEGEDQPAGPGFDEPEPLKRGIGFLRGLKRAAENVWDIITNKEERGSALLDLGAQTIGGEWEEGLDGLAQRITESDLFLPRFENEEAVWETYAVLLTDLALKLALFAVPIYFIAQVLRIKRERMVVFVFCWFFLIFFLVSGRYVWQALGLVFRVIFYSVQIGDPVEDFRKIFDTGLNQLQERPELILLIWISTWVAGAAVWVGAIRYLITLFNLFIFRVIGGIIAAVKLGYGDPKGFFRWAMQTLALFAELTIFWITLKLLLHVLAWDPFVEWSWVLVAPAAIVLVFTPAKASEWLFRKLAEGAGAQIPPEPPRRPLTDRIREAGQTALGVAGVAGHLVREPLGAGLDQWAAQQAAVVPEPEGPDTPGMAAAAPEAGPRASPGAAGPAVTPAGGTGETVNLQAEVDAAMEADSGVITPEGAVSVPDLPENRYFCEVCNTPFLSEGAPEVCPSCGFRPAPGEELGSLLRRATEEEVPRVPTQPLLQDTGRLIRPASEAEIDTLEVAVPPESAADNPYVCERCWSVIYDSEQPGTCPECGFTPTGLYRGRYMRRATPEEVETGFIASPPIGDNDIPYICNQCGAITFSSEPPTSCFSCGYGEGEEAGEQAPVGEEAAQRNTVWEAAKAAAKAKGLEKVTELLAEAGVEVSTETLVALGAKGATAIGSVSAPVAAVAAVLASMFALGTAEAYVIARQISSHRKRHQRIGDYADLAVEAIANSARQDRNLRISAATRRVPKGGEK